MLIKGLQKTTLLDYPGKIAAAIFVSGCNFRCPFCQNKDLILSKLAKKLKTYKEEEIFEFLEKRKGKLEAVCITGGEPTLNADLSRFIKKCKQIGYLVKLDTNGTKPEMMEDLTSGKLVDYVALDYKGPLDNYQKYTLQNKNEKRRKNKKDNAKLKMKIKKTIEILLKSGIDFELRTTVVPTLHTKVDLIEMAKDLENLVIENSLKIENWKLKIKWYLQNFRPKNCLDSKFDKMTPYNREWFEEVLKEIKNIFQI